MSVLFDHIAIGVPRIDETTKFLVGDLGGLTNGGGPSGEFRFWQWRYRNGGVIEILEPLGPPGGFMHRFLENPGPGIHHVTFKVPNLEEQCARAESLGYTVVGKNTAEASWKEAFLHPKQAQGIVVQFVEVDKSVQEAEWERPDSPEWQEPAGPSRAQKTVDLLGLRLRTKSRDDANKQWRDFLRADSVEDTGESEMTFSWLGSPMVLKVEIDPDHKPGPLCLELGGAEGVHLANGPIEPFGARFVTLS